MPDRSRWMRRWLCDGALTHQARRGAAIAGKLRRNPPHRHSMAAMSSAERMRLLRQRRAQGQGSPSCKACGAFWQPRMASFARLQAELCSSCWRDTPEGKEERRERDRRRNASEARRAATAARVRRHRARQREEREAS